MDEKTINLPLNLVNNLLQYMGTKPYGEVYQLVQAIQQVAAPQLTEAPQEPQAAHAAGGTD
jgi:hypothetical protein